VKARAFLSFAVKCPCFFVAIMSGRLMAVSLFSVCQLELCMAQNSNALKSFQLQIS
jgi:hypothetical protein